MSHFAIQVRKGKKDGEPVFWVVNVTNTGTHRIACCVDEETAQAVADTFRA